jgi:endonuclease YncB( thermonuclease family)
MCDTSLTEADQLSLVNELNTLDPKTIKKFTFNNYKTIIKIIKVIDGDTVTGIFKFKDSFYKYNFRINGIDTAEIHSKNENEKNKGLNAKDYLYNLIINKTLLANFLDFDKYGRILVNLYLNDKDLISDHLIQGGYANKYDGKTKKLWI